MGAVVTLDSESVIRLWTPPMMNSTKSAEKIRGCIPKSDRHGHEPAVRAITSPEHTVRISLQAFLIELSAL